MKNFLITILIISLIIIGTLYYKNNNNKEKVPPKEEVSISDYFPLNSNTTYTYQGFGNEYASYSVSTDYINQNMIQFRYNNGGTEFVNVYKVENDKIEKTFTKAEVYYYYNFLSSTNSNEVILKGPIKVGTSWTLENGNVKTITAINKIITTPYKTFEAIEVTTEGDSNSKSYYAKGVGLVGEIFILDGGYEVSSLLSDIKKDSNKNIDVTFYYPNFDTENYRAVVKNIKVETNTDILSKLVESYVDTNYNQVLSPNTKINSLSIDSSNILHIDLNKNFLSDMTSSENETMIFEALANTYGKYYESNQVILTISGITISDLLVTDYSNIVTE